MKLRIVASILLTIFLLLISILIILIIISKSCGVKPPDSYINNTVVIPDGAGGQIVAYQKNMGKGPITYLQRIGADGQNLWEAQGVQIDPSQPYKPYTNSPTELVSDGKGNIFVIWSSGDNINIWIKKFDINGKSIWKNKIKIGSCSKLYKLKAISDGLGGVVTFWYGQKGDFWLQEVNGDGKSLWSPEKRMSDIAGFDITSDSAGDILLFYVTFNRSFYLQKISSTGSNIWDSPVLIGTHNPDPRLSGPASNPTTIYPGSAGPKEYALFVISHKTGGSIIGYSDTWGHSYIDRALNIYKINTEGNVLWNKRLTNSSEDKNNQIADFTTSQVVGNDFGGIFVFYKVMSESKDWSVFVRCIDSSGNETLDTDDYAEVIDDTWNVDQYAGYQAVSDSSGGIIIIWAYSIRDENNRRDGAMFRGQRLDRNGKKQWDEAGVDLPHTRVQYSSPSITLDNSGGFIIGIGSMVWRIGPDGKLLWEKRF